MKLKTGVRLGGLAPELHMALHIIESEYYDFAGFADEDELVITSISDGSHGKRSFHWSGRAADFRSQDLTTEDDKLEFLEIARKAVGPDFEIFLEDIGDSNEHYHIEYQPLKP